MRRRLAVLLALGGGALALAGAAYVFVSAFRDRGERYVDLGEVNGRVFANNVSLGVYAEAVSQEEYREAKLKKLLKQPVPPRPLTFHRWVTRSTIPPDQWPTN